MIPSHALHSILLEKTERLSSRGRLIILLKNMDLNKRKSNRYLKIIEHNVTDPLEYRELMPYIKRKSLNQNELYFHGGKEDIVITNLTGRLIAFSTYDIPNNITKALNDYQKERMKLYRDSGVYEVEDSEHWAYCQMPFTESEKEMLSQGKLPSVVI